MCHFNTPIENRQESTEIQQYHHATTRKNHWYIISIFIIIIIITVIIIFVTYKSFSVSLISAVEMWFMCWRSFFRSCSLNLYWKWFVTHNWCWNRPLSIMCRFKLGLKYIRDLTGAQTSGIHNISYININHRYIQNKKKAGTCTGRLQVVLKPRPFSPLTWAFFLQKDRGRIKRFNNKNAKFWKSPNFLTSRL